MIPISIQFILIALFNIVFISINTQHAPRHYVIRSDTFELFKARGFSVYNQIETRLLFRIESKYSFFPNMKVIRYPSKQEVGRLQRKTKLLVYEADISILSSQTNRWISGYIKQNFQFFGHSSDMHWNNEKISLKRDTFGNTLNFSDVNNQLLAQSGLQLFSLLAIRKYDLKIFSNRYPDQLYFLGIVAYHHMATSTGRG